MVTNGEWTNMCKIHSLWLFRDWIFSMFFPNRPLCTLRCRQLHKPRKKNQSWKICWILWSLDVVSDVGAKVQTSDHKKVRLFWPYPKPQNRSTKCQRWCTSVEHVKCHFMFDKLFWYFCHVLNVFYIWNLWSLVVNFEKYFKLCCFLK